MKTKNIKIMVRHDGLDWIVEEIMGEYVDISYEFENKKKAVAFAKSLSLLRFGTPVIDEHATAIL